MIINGLTGCYIVFDTKNWNIKLDTLVNYLSFSWGHEDDANQIKEMNTNTVILNEPYNIIMAEDGLLFELQGLLIATKEVNDIDSNTINIFSQSFPICERGIVLSQNSIENVHFIGKAGDTIKLYDLPIMHFLRESAGYSLANFFDCLKQYGIKIEVPEQTQINIELYIRKNAGCLFIQTNNRDSLFVEMSIGIQEAEEIAIDEIVAQIGDYRKLFPTPIGVRVTVNEPEKYQKYETNLNNKLRQYEAINQTLD